MAAAARRRYVVQDEPHFAMPRGGYTITLGGVVSVLGILGAIYGFYYSTQSTLTVHSTQIEKLSTKADAVQKEINDNDKNTQAKLSDLHEQTTIANNNQETISKQLAKIGDQINALSLSSAPRR